MYLADAIQAVTALREGVQLPSRFSALVLVSASNRSRLALQQFRHRIHTGRFQQIGVFLTNAAHAHQIITIGVFENGLPGNADLSGQGLSILGCCGFCQ